MNTPRVLGLASTMVLAGITQATAAPTWYEITFTGADVWTYSADNAAQARTDNRRPGGIVTGR